MKAILWMIGRERFVNGDQLGGDDRSRNAAVVLETGEYEPEVSKMAEHLKGKSAVGETRICK